MSGCRTHGDLIGPYVLGALEPDEMEAMPRHMAGCARCAAEERSLAGVPVLLDRAQADEQTQVAASSRTRSSTASSGSARRRAPGRRWPRLRYPRPPWRR